MNEFWKWLLNFFTEHWQDFVLGAGILYNSLKTPKTKEEKKAKELNKQHAKSEKLAKKLSKSLDKEAMLEGDKKHVKS